MTRARLGFLGVGWIGRNRLEAIARDGCAEIVAFADPSPACRETAQAITPDALALEHLGQLLELPLDGVVIATPSTHHAEHSRAALARGLSVFCQEPLGTGDETKRIISAARTRGLLLGVDLPYRYLAAVQRAAAVVQGGGIGRVFAADVVARNAESCCVIDVGAHLVDLALWLLQFPAFYGVDHAPAAGPHQAGVQLRFAGDITVRLSCSWQRSVGNDVVIGAVFYGSEGAVAIKNVGSSLHDFTAERYFGMQRERLAEPPDDWSGRAAVTWARRVAQGEGFDPTVARIADVARVIDAICRASASANVSSVSN